MLASFLRARNNNSLPLAGLQLLESSSHISLQFWVWFRAGGLNCFRRDNIFASSPTVPQQVGRNPKEIAFRLRFIHSRQFRREQSAVRFLQQVICNVATSRNLQEVGEQRTGSTLIKPAKGVLIHDQAW